MSPSPIGPVEPERRVRVDDRHAARLAGERVAVDAAGQADDLDRVVDDGPPGAQALPRLVEQGHERPVHVEVAGGDRQVGRLERAAALLVDDVEAADAADEVLHDLERARPAARGRGPTRRPARRRPRRRGGRHRRSRFRAGFRACSVNSAGRQRDELLDLGAVEADRAPLPVDPRPRAGERIERAVAQALHADLLEDPERRPVDRLDLVGADDLERPERVAQRPPGQPGHAAGDPPGPVARRLAIRHRTIGAAERSSRLPDRDRDRIGETERSGLGLQVRQDGPVDRAPGSDRTSRELDGSRFRARAARLASGWPGP